MSVLSAKRKLLRCGAVESKFLPGTRPLEVFRNACGTGQKVPHKRNRQSSDFVPIMILLRGEIRSFPSSGVENSLDRDLSQSYVRADTCAVTRTYRASCRATAYCPDLGFPAGECAAEIAIDVSNAISSC